MWPALPESSIPTRVPSLPAALSRTCSKEKMINISMDGRGRCMDNIFTERLWRSLKYEEVYIRDYQCVSEGRRGIDYYFNFYNHERPHQSLNYMTPAEVYFQRAVKEEKRKMPALTSLSSKISNFRHPKCNLNISKYCLDKRVHLIRLVSDSIRNTFFLLRDRGALNKYRRG